MVDYITAFFGGLIVGFLIGYLLGAKAEGRRFYKYPSTAWKIRGR